MPLEAALRNPRGAKVALHSVQHLQPSKYYCGRLNILLSAAAIMLSARPPGLLAHPRALRRDQKRQQLIVRAQLKCHLASAPVQLVVGDDFPIFVNCDAIGTPSTIRQLGKGAQLCTEVRTQVAAIDIVAAQLMARRGEDKNCMIMHDHATLVALAC